MKARRVITLSLVMASACFSLWRIPGVFNSAAGNAPGGAKGIMGMDVKSIDTGRLQELMKGLSNSNQVLADLESRTVKNKPGERGDSGINPEDLMVFPGGDLSLTAEQKAELLRQAALLRPKVPVADAKAGQKKAKSGKPPAVKVTVHRDAPSAEPAAAER